MIPTDVIPKITERFATIDRPVKIDFFDQLETQLQVPGRRPCPSCLPAREMIEQLAGLNDYIELRSHDFHTDTVQVKKWHAERIPALVIHGEVNRPVRLYGFPGGAFLPFLVDMIVAASKPPPTLPQDLKSAIKKLRDPVRVRVLGSMQHPHSAQAAATAFGLALLSDKIDASAFVIEDSPDIAMQLQLSRIPLTLVNDLRGFGGVTSAQGLAQFCLNMQTGPDEAASPPIIPGSMVIIEPPAPPQPPQSGPGPAKPEPRRTPGGIILPGQ
ncbi:MAG: hypothetical protein DK306_001273 [Chloroflexi bacterium]|nr:MAG: hypothetical protein DK306_001273 [Chloroflexota bacterium]